LAIRIDFLVRFSILSLKANRIVDFNFRNRIVKTFDSSRIKLLRFDFESTQLVYKQIDFKNLINENIFFNLALFFVL